MRDETVDIIKNILSDIKLDITIDNIIDNGNGTYLLETCNTRHLQEKRDITIGSRTYRILDVDYNKSILVKGKVVPSEMTFDVYPPYYLHGQAPEANAQLDMIEDGDIKTPLVYLIELLTDRFYPNDELIERTVDIRIFFLTTADYDNWLTTEHYNKAIKPMRNLVYNFIDALDRSKIIGRFAEYYDLTNHAKFGIFVLRKGATRRIFNDNYSGVEFKMRLPILKDLTCSDC